MRIATQASPIRPVCPVKALDELDVKPIVGAVLGPPDGDSHLCIRWVIVQPLKQEHRG
jgi:hypothetical protein